MDETNATSINTIVRDIIALTDSLNSKEELKSAWNEIRLALDYLSAKDSMFRSREELQKKLEKKRLDLKYPKE
jgi:hypothetical protein